MKNVYPNKLLKIDLAYFVCWLQHKQKKTVPQYYMRNSFIRKENLASQY